MRCRLSSLSLSQHSPHQHPMAVMYVSVLSAKLAEDYRSVVVGVDTACTRFKPMKPRLTVIRRRRGTKHDVTSLVMPTNEPPLQIGSDMRDLQALDLSIAWYSGLEPASLLFILWFHTIYVNSEFSIRLSSLAFTISAYERSRKVIVYSPSRQTFERLTYCI